MVKQKVNIGTIPADSAYGITITENGPYLIYGRPPLAMQYIMPNEFNESWYFQEGRHFSTEDEPTALCRCGASKRKPYCDGSHAKHRWDPHLTAPPEALIDNVDITSGDEVTITDNQKYCVFARFCDAAGGVWNNTEASFDSQAAKLAIRAATICPSSRLTAWKNDAEEPYEPNYEPSLGLIEDSVIGASGGLWVRGGIRIERENGRGYEIRNRTVLCRCGHSSNKPYCDGSHAAMHWRDELEGAPEGETIPEKVY